MRSDVSSKFPGHLRSAPHLKNETLYLLLMHYDAYDPFVNDCRSVKREFGAILPEPYRAPIENVVAARGAIRALAERWNLHLVPQAAEFDFRMLRQAVDQVDRTFGKVNGSPFRPFGPTMGGFVPENPAVTYDGRRWEWSLTSAESLGEFEERIARDLQMQRREIPSDIRAQVGACKDEAGQLGWSLMDLPHQLPKHVSWLFSRLCPQPDKPMRYEAIASREGESTDARRVRRDVIALARSMGITLPRLAVGRPRTRG